MKVNPFLLTDFYKIGHPFQYPPGTINVYSNATARSCRIPGITHMVYFGGQYVWKEYLVDYFNRNFFSQPKYLVMGNYKRRIQTALGGIPSYKHIEDLHDLGYLPLRIKSLPEGALVPLRVPFLTITNTIPEFYWLTNFFETLISASLWQACTSATLAFEYRKLLDHYGRMTGMPTDFIQWQGHDFSFRGMSSVESAIISGMGHLLSFTGTDSIPAIDALEQYYEADADKELIGGSIPATEHSVMCSGSKDSELDTFKRLITEVYPSGMVSVVSDTWDLWKVLTEYLPALKDIVMARDGKLVIRPDSGDPVDIICGSDTVANNGKPAAKGVIELLWDVFGGTKTPTGHKLLDSHVGAIYGDSINLDRAHQICQRLMEKGFASQCVFGIGSYTYQYNTRDTFGIAMKATYVEVLLKEGEPPWTIDCRNIFKNPVTDDGVKKSATGLLSVKIEKGEYVLHEKVSEIEEEDSELQEVFKDGRITKMWSLREIREHLLSNL